jgi:hypothetical protein
VEEEWNKNNSAAMIISGAADADVVIVGDA